MKNILVVFGTRPEIIKLAPVIIELRKYPNDYNVIVCNTEQQKELSNQTLAYFGLKADINLDIPVSELFTTERGMKLAKALAEYAVFTCKAKVSKTDIKTNAKESHTMPVFAKLVNNQTLTIK